MFMLEIRCGIAEPEEGIFVLTRNDDDGSDFELNDIATPRAPSSKVIFPTYPRRIQV
jgi:hypothetical protein